MLAQSQSTCRNESLPLQAQELISKSFPGWRVKLPTDLVGYEKELWKETHPKECPGMASGHLKDPNQVAFGLLLVPSSGSETGYKIVVLARSGSAYSLQILDQAEGQPGSASGLVIAKVAPGKYPGFDEPQAISLKLDGLEAQWIEKASVLYFWQDGKFQTLQTSD